MNTQPRAERLQAGHLACRDCGQAVLHNPATGAMFFAQRNPRAERLARYNRQPDADSIATVTLCPDCDSLLEYAEAAAQRLSLDYAATATALRAAAIIEADQLTDSELWSAADFYVQEALVKHGWPDQPTPIQFTDTSLAEIGACAPERWSWLDTDLRERLTRAISKAKAEADHLRDKPAVMFCQLSHNRACSYCGLAGTMAPTATAYRAKDPSQVAESAFVKRGVLTLCRVCSTATGNRSQAAQHAAQAAAGVREQVEAAQDEATRERRTLRIPKITTYENANATPAREPWAHVDLAEYAKQVREALTPPPPPLTLEALDARLAKLEHRIMGDVTEPH